VVVGIQLGVTTELAVGSSTMIVAFVEALYFVLSILPLLFVSIDF
jgi:hypothetical protein